RGTARHAVGSAGIADTTMVGVLATDAEGPLVEVCLADHDAAEFAHPPDERCVPLSRGAGEEAPTGGGHRAPGGPQVLDGHDRAVALLVGQRDECVQIGTRADAFASFCWGHSSTPR